MTTASEFEALAARATKAHAHFVDMLLLGPLIVGIAGRFAAEVRAGADRRQAAEELAQRIAALRDQLPTCATALENLAGEIRRNLDSV